MTARTRWGAALAATFALALAAGCSSGGGGETGGETAADDGPVTLQFWHSMGGANGESIDRVVAAFNESQDDVEVVATFQGGYGDTLTKLQQAIPAGTAPDISMVERAFVPLLAEAKVLADLNPFLEESDAISADDFVEGLMGNITFDGELNAMPFNRSTPMLHVNATMLGELGLEIPTTWDEMEEVAAALTSTEGETTRYGVTMNYESWWPISLIVQQGGGFFNEDGTEIGFDEEGVEAFEFIKRMQDAGSLYYPPTTDSGNVTGQMFLSGQVGMVVNSSGNIGNFLANADFDYQTAFLPEGERAAAPTGGANLVMLADSEHQDAAWTFMEWLATDPQGGRQFIIDTGYVPFTVPMAESEEFQTLFAEEPQREVAYQQLANSVDTNNSPKFAAIDQEFLQTIQAIMYDDADIESSLEAFRERANQMLAE